MNRRVCIYGALDYRTGRVHYMAHPKKNAQQFHEFLRQLLEAKSERRVVLVLDNASYHRTKKVLRCWRTTPTTPSSSGSRATVRS